MSMYVKYIRVSLIESAYMYVAVYNLKTVASRLYRKNHANGWHIDIGIYIHVVMTNEANVWQSY